MTSQDQVLPVGMILDGRYRIMSEAISFDLGSVYEGYDVRHQRAVVVSFLATRLSPGADIWAQFDRLQQALARLGKPDLVLIEQVGVLAEGIYLVRPQVQGRSLAALISAGGKLEVPQAVAIAASLSSILAAVHQAGLVHGSLSPHSVLLADDGRVLLLDTGLLPVLRPILAPPAHPWGRFPFISPEQAAALAVRPASDVYVIGSLLYYLLAGRPPFSSGDSAVLALQHLRWAPPSLQLLVPKVSEALDAIVRKTLSKEPSGRYRNAGQLAYILKGQMGDQARSEQVQPVAPRRPATPVRLVVPAPPSVAVSIDDPLGGTYASRGKVQPEWEEPVAVDWLMVVLLMAALVAVLGLIPLWRTVYRRYAAPPLPTPVLYYRPLLEGGFPWAIVAEPGEGSAPSGLCPTEVNKYISLDRLGPIWYNQQEQDDVVELAGRPMVWEPSLRLMTVFCATLEVEQNLEAE